MDQELRDDYTKLMQWGDETGKSVYAMLARQYMKANGTNKYPLKKYREFFGAVAGEDREQIEFGRFLEVVGKELCPRCNGVGGWHGWPGYTCHKCGGAGFIEMRKATKRHLEAKAKAAAKATSGK